MKKSRLSLFVYHPITAFVVLAAMWGSAAYVMLAQPAFTRHPFYQPVLAAISFVTLATLAYAYYRDYQKAKQYHPPVIAEFDNLEAMQDAEHEYHR